MILSLIVAHCRNRVIGTNGDMPWGRSMKTDLKRFRELTTGHTVVMGRKTFESIGQPLPNRRNIILTTQKDYRVDGCETMTLDKLLSIDTDEEVFVIGGGEIYNKLLPHAQRCYLTKIHWHFQGDTFFPYLRGIWNICYSEFHPKSDRDPYDHTFYVYEQTFLQEGEQTWNP